MARVARQNIQAKLKIAACRAVPGTIGTGTGRPFTVENVAIEVRDGIEAVAGEVDQQSVPRDVAGKRPRRGERRGIVIEVSKLIGGRVDAAERHVRLLNVHVLAERNPDLIKIVPRQWVQLTTAADRDRIPVSAQTVRFQVIDKVAGPRRAAHVDVGNGRRRAGQHIPGFQSLQAATTAPMRALVAYVQRRKRHQKSPTNFVLGGARGDKSARGLNGYMGPVTRCVTVSGSLRSPNRDWPHDVDIAGER